MVPEKLALEDGFARLSEHWRPKVAAELNGQEVKLAKLRGEFVWHSHADTDELFLVWRGSLRIEFRNGAVTLGAGELLVVPRGVEHRPVADDEVELLLFEPAGVRNTGDVTHPTLTAPRGEKL